MPTPLTGFVGINVTIVLQGVGKVAGVLAEIGDDGSILLNRDDMPGQPPGTTVSTWIPYSSIILIVPT